VLSVIERARRRYSEDGVVGVTSAAKYHVRKSLNPRQLYWRYVASRPYSRVSRVVPGCVAIAVTEQCNLRCQYCARRTISQVPDMKVEDYKRLVKKMWWCHSGVNLIGLGEQLLHKDIVEILNWTTKRTTVTLATNGMVDLERKRLLDALLRCRLVRFSIDTVDKNLLRKIRTGADFDTIDHNLRALLLARRMRGIPSNVTKRRVQLPIVSIESVLTQDTLPGVIDVIRYARQLEGLDDIKFDSVMWSEYQDAYGCLRQSEGQNGRQHILEAVSYVREHGDLYAFASTDSECATHTSKLFVRGLVPDRVFSSPTAWSQCRALYDGLGVRPNGDIYPCCYKPDVRIGNAFTEDVLAAWNGPVMQEIRNQVLTDNPPECCHECNLAFQGTYPQWTPKIPAR